MAKHKPNREELLQEQNQLLKAALGLDAEIDQAEETAQSNDPFAGLRKLTMPPKVGIDFYIGHPPSSLLWPQDNED